MRQPTLYPGDKVEVIGSDSGSWVLGLRGVIRDSNGILGYPYHVAGIDGWSFKSTQLRLIRKGRKPSMPKHKVGDLVKVIYDDNYNKSKMDQSRSPYVGKQGKILSVNGWGDDVETYPYVVEGLPTGLSEEEIKLISHKGEERMNILTFAKLSKEQRQLNKVGLLDDEGQLTDDGTELVLNILAQQPEIQKQLVELSKKYKDEECKK